VGPIRPIVSSYLHSRIVDWLQSRGIGVVPIFSDSELGHLVNGGYGWDMMVLARAFF